MAEETDYSGEALLNFLEYAGQKGLLKQETARSRRVAVTKILGAAEPEEAADMRNFDLNSVFDRFQNLHGHIYKPDSLSVYKSRFETALKDFLNWKKNPSSFRISSHSRNTSPKKDKKGKKAAASDNKKNIYSGFDYYKNSRPIGESHRAISSPVIMPVPLKDASVVITVENVPNNLTQDEAEKIKKILHSLEHMLDAYVFDNGSEKEAAATDDDGLD